jgi:tripartite-type tricarboxylate transporter receptor subunit TctC
MHAFPDRPITLIVPWAAGGGTDAVARQIAFMLERDLKQPVNVVNRIGGSGVVGHSAIASAAPDGYTIGMITLKINMMHWVGLTQRRGSGRRSSRCDARYPGWQSQGIGISPTSFGTL